jgi:hypothetical protein
VRKIRYEWFGTYIQIQMLIMKVSRMIMHKLTHWYHHLSLSDGQHPFMFRSSCQNTIFTWIYDREFYPKYIIWKMWVPLIMYKVIHILWIGSMRLSWLGGWKETVFYRIVYYLIFLFVCYMPVWAGYVVRNEITKRTVAQTKVSAMLYLPYFPAHKMHRNFFVRIFRKMMNVF